MDPNNMSLETDDVLEETFNRIVARDPNQAEFIQSVEEVFYSLEPLFKKNPEYLRVFEMMAEPERVIQFRVPWQDDKGSMQYNRGFRVQFNQAIGPYKGGLRFHPTVTLSIMKFLGFEQTIKNALTSLPMGGGKGGSDFDPKGKSDGEVLRFCQSFMLELSRHIGPDTDVPAGDIGVGRREIGFMFGQYKRIKNTHDGVLTGKGLSWGGSHIRPEATGYGLVYVLEIAMKDNGINLKGKKVTISGSGNVAIFAAEKLLELGAVILSFSDSSGTIHEPNGFDIEKLNVLTEIKQDRGRCEDYKDLFATSKYYPGERPWNIKCDVALPCATQNEISEEDAKTLINGGCKWVFEGSNMGSTNEAIKIYQNELPNFNYLPAKAANAGGVAVSGLEMSQNSTRTTWSSGKVDSELKSIMGRIYRICREEAKRLGSPGDLQLGANAAGFKKVADAMLDQGYII